MTQRELYEFFESQLEAWPLAFKNYKTLESIRKKPFKTGNLEGVVQYNPARAVSTLAKIDKESIKERKCFLCEENRPKEQHSIDLLGGEFQLLVNPYPILPYHFTIAAARHVPQEYFRQIGEELAEELPGMTIFFNGEGAGASAPDHLHFQAVPSELLPLVDLIDKEILPELPFHIVNQPATKCDYPLNAYFWKDKEGQEVKSFHIKRKSHRPSFYFKEAPERRAVSPGGIDMAGVIVTPYAEDFDLISSEDIYKIYSEVAE